MAPLDDNLTLGQFLRKEREKRGLSIEQVASATKIGVRQLHSLESDQYSDLPAKPFIRGFVTSYCRFVGLDHKEVLTHFSSYIDTRVHERPNRESGHSGYAFEKREGNEQSRMILGIVMGGFVVLGGIAMVVLKPSLHHHKHSHADKLRAAHSPTPVPSVMPSGNVVALASLPPSPSPLVGPSNVIPSPSVAPSAEAPVVASANSPSPTPLPSLTPVAQLPSALPSAIAQIQTLVPPSPSPTSASDPLNSGLGLKPNETAQRLIVKAKESVWVRYRVDDKVVMQFPLRKDKVLVLRARQSIVLQIGQPANVVMSNNGGPYKLGNAANHATRQGDATYFFPAQLSEIKENPFPGWRTISDRVVPESPAPEPSPTET
jgi:cytoskeletal protein RodZ